METEPLSYPWNTNPLCDRNTYKNIQKCLSVKTLICYFPLPQVLLLYLLKTHSSQCWQTKAENDSWLAHTHVSRQRWQQKAEKKNKSLLSAFDSQNQGPLKGKARSHVNSHQIQEESDWGVMRVRLPYPQTSQRPQRQKPLGKLSALDHGGPWEWAFPVSCPSLTSGMETSLEAWM